MTSLQMNPRRKKTPALLLLFGGNVLFFLTLWLLRAYDGICFDQVLFQLKTSSAGVHYEFVGSAVLRVGGAACAAMGLEIALYRLLCGNQPSLMGIGRYRAYCMSGMPAFFRRTPLALAFALLLAALLFFIAKLDIVPYIRTVTTDSDFIEEHYADPAETPVTFPDQKRNLVYIYLESMESTFADVGEVNCIPELTRLAEENISFSNTEGIGGALPYAGTTWTAAAMVSQTSGVPVKVPLTANAYGFPDAFMPGVASLGEILQKEGYSQTLLVGSDAEFHGREPYFLQHGGYTILDINALKEAGRLAEDYRVWWGFEDEKLFAYAREELTRLAALDQPFNLTLLTADTHFPEGYVCRLCDDAHDTQYANVLSCSSRQVYAFVQWIMEQPFYEHTTIILCGDHLTMDAEFLTDLDEGYVRTVYNCIINAPVSPVREHSRQFATFDMYPTTLAALGAQIEGDRLGLGTNLFSDTPTLTEQYGFDALDEELQKESEFYNTHLLKGLPL